MFDGADAEVELLEVEPELEAAAAELIMIPDAVGMSLKFKKGGQRVEISEFVNISARSEMGDRKTVMRSKMSAKNVPVMCHVIFS